MTASAASRLIRLPFHAVPQSTGNVRNRTTVRDAFLTGIRDSRTFVPGSAIVTWHRDGTCRLGLGAQYSEASRTRFAGSRLASQATLTPSQVRCQAALRPDLPPLYQALIYVNSKLTTAQNPLALRFASMPSLARSLAKPHPQPRNIVSEDDSLLSSFARHLRAERKDDDTIAHYIGATRQFAAFCQDEHLPSLPNVSREHVELWLEALHLKYKPATVRNRYLGTRMFFDWLVDEGEIKLSPFGAPRDRRIKPPSLEESPKDVVSKADMERLLSKLEKEKRWRDAALASMLYDAGLRATELADLRAEDLDIETGRAMIRKTKNNKVRVVMFAPRTLRYIDRHWRQRRAAPEYVVSGHRAKLTRSGIYWAIRGMFAEIGVNGIGAHDMRHTSATHHSLGGMSERDLMTFYGWQDTDSARRYTEQVAVETALAAHRKASPL